MTIRGLLETVQGALWISWKCVCSLRVVIYKWKNHMHRLVCRGEAFLTVCIPQEASIDFYWAEFSAQISYRHIAFSPFALYPAPPYFPLSLFLPFPKSMSHHLSWPLWGRGRGNKWNINTPVSLTLSAYPHGAAGQKAPSAVHLSPVTSAAKPSSQ